MLIGSNQNFHPGADTFEGLIEIAKMAKMIP
jgi:hypothetical protein